MARKKAPDQSKLYSHGISFRVSGKVYEGLKNSMRVSGHKTICAYCRAILYKEKIKFCIKDASMDGAMGQLCGTHKELDRITVNINQIAQGINLSDNINSKALHTLKVLEQIGRVNVKIGFLLSLVSQLSKKWLEK
jgi:hypothetical protein